MGYKALVTLDLPGASDEKRETFYRVLRDNKWHKIQGLSTAWELSFKDEVTRAGALTATKSDLETAKRTSGVSQVHYALQMDYDKEVHSGRL